MTDDDLARLDERLGDLTGLAALLFTSDERRRIGALVREELGLDRADHGREPRDAETADAPQPEGQAK
ncbi:hypothetical protein DSM104299_00987 [Baekduia alba]|uniref:hypothetical protein n=1 Tax=Baekduia alba TaxID=2997333 RepID=UPI0023414BF1|nr:hypothetical protein [Baekduia alba]WCB92297.1 hypothetical protein DSM104299_00987 [Baekduia alba]